MVTLPVSFTWLLVLMHPLLYPPLPMKLFVSGRSLLHQASLILESEVHLTSPEDPRAKSLAGRCPFVDCLSFQKRRDHIIHIISLYIHLNETTHASLRVYLHLSRVAYYEEVPTISIQNQSFFPDDSVMSTRSEHQFSLLRNNFPPLSQGSVWFFSEPTT